MNDNYLIQIERGTLDKENICQNISQCFISFFSYGVRNGGGIGDILQMLSFDNISYTSRYIVDMIYFIVVILIFLNMIND